MVRPLNFVGIGAARAGSTWMAKCLQEHPQIFVPMRKELYLFNRNVYFKDNGKLNYKGKLVLRRCFSGADKAQVCGEFTPRYMINPVALQRIARNYKGAKIIAILRDPVERAFSQYNYFKNIKGKEHRGDFESALIGEFYGDYILKSSYTGLVKNVYEVFPKDNVKLFLYEAICRKPSYVVANLFRFLDVNASFSLDTLVQFVNYSFSRESKPNSEEIVNRDSLLEQISVVHNRSEVDLDLDV